MAIAALLVAFYPIFPTNVMDNRSHLQAFRHFWVLATEQRCLVAKDVQTGQPISVPVEIKMKRTASNEPVLHRTTPCLLPPIDQIASLSTACGPQFWDVKLDFSNDKLRAAFAGSQSLYLRRRPPHEGAFASTLAALGSDGKRDDPLSWLFSLPSLRSVSHAERAAVLDSGEEEQEAGRAVDAKMELERGVTEGGERERLQGAKLLFEWAGARDRLVRNGARYGNQKDTSREKKGDDGDDADLDSSEETVWWMRDGAIEALKGKVWLAGREGAA
jgi:anaphase-promoting complex subunit 1